jgi:hypothetical protein
MAAILFVRVRSGLESDELVRRVRARLPRFRDVPGLLQKFYGQDPATGDVCGIFLFEDQESLTAYRSTDLARSAATAYEVLEFRAESYDALFSLYPANGPLAD